MNTTPPIRFGLTGLGGYAGYICDRLLEDARSPQPSASLVAVCDPDLDRFSRRVYELARHGVWFYRRYEDLLAADIEAVWLPLPIDLHRPYTEQALAAGKAVMCEKPAAGSVDDVDAMIAARDAAAGLPVAVGYQDMYHPAVAALKRRLVAGEFGKPTSVRVIGCWPRTERYFGRNDWAGKFRRDGRWVMDSPANNALAHFLHLALFLLGPTVDEVGYPTAVAAELYRANRIENYDTCSLRFTVGAGAVPLLVGFTHACASTVDPVVTLETERGRIRYLAGRHVEIHRDGDGDGRGEILPLSPHPHRHMLSVFKHQLRTGTTTSALGATLETARAHVVAVNAASEATPIVDVPVDYVDALPSADQTMLRTIREIGPAMQSALADQVLLHETGLASWTRPAGLKRIDAYRHFAGPLLPAGAPPAGRNGHATGSPPATMTPAARAETYVGKRHPAPAAAAKA
jgi:predicted dehydrogenase